MVVVYCLISTACCLTFDVRKFDAAERLMLDVWYPLLGVCMGCVFCVCCSMFTVCYCLFHDSINFFISKRSMSDVRYYNMPIV